MTRAEAAALVDALRANRTIYATCPSSGEEYKVGASPLFHGNDFPPEALEAKKAWMDRILAQHDEIEKLRRRSMEGFTDRSVAVKFGKTMEKIIPSLPGFPYPAHDLRPLYDPIDYLAFEGLRAGRVKSVGFLDVKTGGSRLSGVQRQVRDAVNDGKVAFRRVGP